MTASHVCSVVQHSRAAGLHRALLVVSFARRKCLVIRSARQDRCHEHSQNRIA